MRHGIPIASSRHGHRYRHIGDLSKAITGVAPKRRCGSQLPAFVPALTVPPLHTLLHSGAWVRHLPRRHCRHEECSAAISAASSTNLSAEGDGLLARRQLHKAKPRSTVRRHAGHTDTEHVLPGPSAIGTDVARPIPTTRMMTA